MRTQARRAVGLLATLCLSATGASGSVGVAVVGFDAAGPPGRAIEEAIGDALRARGVARVYDGAAVDEPLAAGSADRAFRRVGFALDLDAVVVGGRVAADERPGSAAAPAEVWRVDVRSGHSGGLVASHRFAPGEPAHEASLVRLAQAVADDVAPAPSEGAAPAPVPAADRPDGLRGLLDARSGSGEAITIESDELELRGLGDEGRLLVFQRSVRVERGDMTLHAAELEAWYPPQESEPSRIVARGSVRVEQPGQSARCEEAEYSRDLDRLTCRGEAELVQGCDVVRGETIEFDLGADRARVLGAARVVIQPREGSDCGGSAQ